MRVTIYKPRQDDSVCGVNYRSCPPDSGQDFIRLPYGDNLFAVYGQRSIPDNAQIFHALLRFGAALGTSGRDQFRSVFDQDISYHSGMLTPLCLAVLVAIS